MNWKRCIEMGVKSSPQFARALCASRRIPLSHAYAFARRPRVETRLHVQRDFGCLELIEHHLRLASLHAFCDDKLPRIIVDNITRVDFLGCVDLGKDLSNLAQAKVRMCMMRIGLLAVSSAIRFVDLLVQAEQDQVPTGLKNPKPFNQDPLRILKILKEMGRVDVVEDAVGEPV